MVEETKTFYVSIVIFLEGSTWTALALEMNVRGYGSTKSDAVADVQQMLTAQISYAVQMGHPDSVWCVAEQKYWHMFEEARRKHFVAELTGSTARSEPFADMVPLAALSIPRDEWILAGA